MRRTVFILAFSLSAMPIGFAQSSSTTEHTQEHSSTQVNPDGTAVHNSSKAKERTDSTTTGDGSSTTSKSRESHSKTRVRTNDGTDKTTTEHHSSSTDKTTTTTPPLL